MPLPPLQPPRSFIIRLFSFVRGLFASTCLFAILLFINVLQMLSWLLKPLFPQWFRRFNRNCANFWWGLCYLWGEYGHKIKIEHIGDTVPPRENAVLICNHQDMADIPALFKLAYQSKRLGDIKWFVKDVLKYVPGVGWGMVFLDCLFVKRNWTADKSKIDRVFRNVRDNKVPLWIISFVEGTRMRPGKLKRSQEYAQKQGLKPTKHVLLPRTKGFTATVTGLSDHLDAVYDVTIGYIDGVPSLWQWLQGFCKHVYIHVERFPIQTLPNDQDQLSEWVKERFYLKDKRLDEFYKTGTFPTTSDVS